MSKLTRFLARVYASIAIADPVGVPKGKADWFVRLSFDQDPKRLKGGGALIGDGTWVLTAAHVVALDPPERAYLEAYSTADLKDPARVTGICIHPHFGDASPDESPYLPNDLALVRIDTRGSSVLRLPSSTPPAGTPGSVYGWGYSEETKKISKRLNKNGRKVKIKALQGKSFLATSMGCTGDSGGPFEVGGEVVGIYKGDNSGGDCSSAPDHYTSVAAHRTWIDDVMAGRGRCKPLPA